MTATTTPAVDNLRAQTDKSTSTWHLGAAEKGAVCFCGCRLMEPGDERKFAAKYPADARQYETSPDLSKVTCKACLRTGAWKVTAATGVAAIGVAAPKPEAAPEAAPATGQASAGNPALPKPPSTRKRPSAATRAAATIEAAVAEVTGEPVIEADPETGLPRIKPEVQAKADAIAAAQKARNAEAGK